MKYVCRVDYSYVLTAAWYLHTYITTFAIASREKQQAFSHCIIITTLAAYTRLAGSYVT